MAVDINSQTKTKNVTFLFFKTLSGNILFLRVLLACNRKSFSHYMLAKPLAKPSFEFFIKYSLVTLCKYFMLIPAKLFKRFLQKNICCIFFQNGLVTKFAEIVDNIKISFFKNPVL